MNSEKVIGTSKVGPKYRITLIDYVREKLSVDIGDLVVYVENEKGDIFLRTTKLMGRKR